MKSFNLKSIVIIFVVLFLVIFSFMLKQPILNLDELWNYSFSKNIANGLIPYTDFNLVQTPFLFFFTSMFLKFIFNGLLMTRLLGAILSTGILVMTYLVLSKLLKNKYINIFIVLNICLILIHLFILDYNLAVLLFTLIILNYELKSGKEELLKLNIKKDFLVGIIAGLAIITKQSTGLMVAVAYVIYKWLAIRKKEDFLLAFKISLSRGLGVLVPVMIFFAYLFITNSFMDFISFCVLGISEFSNSIPYSQLFTFGKHATDVTILAIMVPILIIYTIFYLIRNFKFETLESKNILKLFVFGIASFIVTFPISDDVHFLIGSVVLIILSVYIVSTHLIIKKDSVSEALSHIIICLNYIIMIILVVFMCFNYYKYIANSDRISSLSHYKGIPMYENIAYSVDITNEYIEEENLKGNNVYILDGEAVLHDIPADRYNKYFDLLLKGNLGQNGVQNVIDKINGLEDNSIFLVKTDKSRLNWQVPTEVIEYISNSYNLIGTVGIFDVYSKK